MQTPRPTLLLISQVYVPDPASVGQHMHDAAAAMVKRGYRVKVYTARRGYEDSSKRYPKRETRDGVEVIRLPFSSFGKTSIPIRLLGGSLFVLQATIRGLLTKNLQAILITTSPPMASVAAVIIRLFRRRTRVTFWAMDINPDQLIAMGKTTANSTSALALDFLNRLILRRADAVVTLDPVMAKNLNRKIPVGNRMHIMPPWPHNEHHQPVPDHENPFRQEHNLQDKFVIMYSGNISPSHPLDTILQAAIQLQDEPRLVFLFIGGGLAKQQIDSFVQQHHLANIKTLPYQPLNKIKYSLSAADIHLVALGNAMVGIAHPCKGYGALAVGRPILLLGPKDSHVGEIIDHYDVGYQVDHDQVQQAVDIIRRILREDPARLAALRENALHAVEATFNHRRLINQFCRIIESDNHQPVAEAVSAKSDP